MDLVPPLTRPQPAPPKQQHSFTSWAVQHPTIPAPGNWLDSELAHAHRTVRSLIDWAAVSLNSDGSLRPDAVRRALSIPVSRDTGNSDSDDQFASNVAQDYAVLSAAWAEHMPDTIPPNILASNDITGDHWSSRWWANQAAELLAQMGHSDFADAPGDGLIYGRLNHAWAPTLSLTGGQLTGGLTLTNGNLTLNAGGFVGIWAELGSMLGPITPFLDFHSSGTGSDYDTRLIASGGTATPGQGTLTFVGAQFNVNSAMTVSGALTGSPLISYRNSTQGGGVGSQSSGWLAGFNVTSGGTLQWGNMDAAGNVSGVRMSLDTSSRLNLAGALAAAGNINGAEFVALGGVWANNQSASPNYGFNKSGPNYVFWWGISGAYNYLDVNGTWHWVQGGADRMSLTSAGSLAIPGNFNVSGDLTCSGNFSGNFSPTSGVTAALHATGPGVSYPGISAIGSGQDHSFGFDWDGSGSLRVFVDGSFVGRLVPVYP
jgi:hypothetical protein